MDATTKKLLISQIENLGKQSPEQGVAATFQLLQIELIESVLDRGFGLLAGAIAEASSADAARSQREEARLAREEERGVQRDTLHAEQQTAMHGVELETAQMRLQQEKSEAAAAQDRAAELRDLYPIGNGQPRT